MLGFSLSKLLFTAVVVVLVWMVFRHAGRILQGGRQKESRVERARRAAEDMTRARAGHAQGDGQGEGPADRGQPQTVDLQQCPQCGAYIVRGGTCQCGYRDRA